jgi:hypothetical protein
VCNEKGHRVKIGRSSDVSRRVKELQAGNHNKLSVVRVWENQGHVEHAVHRYLEAVREEGEWFDTSVETVIRAVEVLRSRIVEH